MNVYLSTLFLRSLKRLIKKNPSLHHKVKEKISLFQNNPEHPTLKLHKLTGGQENVWSLSVGYNLRITFVYQNGDVVLVNIDTHDEIY